MSYIKTRVALWNARAEELSLAQELDRTIEQLYSEIIRATDKAFACRYRAEELKRAAEALAELDSTKGTEHDKPSRASK